MLIICREEENKIILLLRSLSKRVESGNEKQGIEFHNGQIQQNRFGIFTGNGDVALDQTDRETCGGAS